MMRALLYWWRRRRSLPPGAIVQLVCPQPACGLSPEVHAGLWLVAGYSPAHNEYRLRRPFWKGSALDQTYVSRGALSVVALESRKFESGMCACGKKSDFACERVDDYGRCDRPLCLRHARRIGVLAVCPECHARTLPPPSGLEG